MLCVAIYMQKKEITDAQWNFLLRGPLGAKGKYKPTNELIILSIEKNPPTNFF